MVMTDGTLLVSGGLAIGLPVTLAATHFIGSRLFGVGPSDPVTMVAATALMLAVAGVARLPSGASRIAR